MKFRLTVLTSLLLAFPALAEDVVTYRDRTAKPEKVATVSGNITDETVNTIKIKPNVGPEKEISAADIIEIVYTVPGAMLFEYQNARNAEGRRSAPDGKKAIVDALGGYRKVLSSLKDEKTNKLQRQLHYKIATLAAAQAESKEDKLAAAEELDRFRKANPNSWQLVSVVRQLAALWIENGKSEEAAKAFDDLAKVPNLSKEVKQEVELSVIDVLMQAAKFPEAESKITAALGAVPPTDPQAQRLKIYQIGCQVKQADLEKVLPQLNDIIDKTSDPTLKALAYNTRGDVQFAKGQKKDAMWSYLWVDVVYYQDKGEHLKAMERLVKVFKDFNDEDHARKYEDKLARNR
jgi:tetratricopeptide (TPR) repeat protein